MRHSALGGFALAELRAEPGITCGEFQAKAEARGLVSCTHPQYRVWLHREL